jgi:hypothetical protein
MERLARLEWLASVASELSMRQEHGMSGCQVAISLLLGGRCLRVANFGGILFHALR